MYIVTRKTVEQERRHLLFSVFVDVLIQKVLLPSSSNYKISLFTMYMVRLLLLWKLLVKFHILSLKDVFLFHSIKDPTVS